MTELFIYNSKYKTYRNCYFQIGHYLNGNKSIEIWNAEEGPITKVTVNPDIKIASDYIAIKDYSENEGMIEFLCRQGLVELDPVRIIKSGWVEIPVHRLTNKGLTVFK